MKKHIRIKVKTLLLLITAVIVVVLGANELISGYDRPDTFTRFTASTLKSENQRLSRIFEENDYQIYMLVAIEDGYMMNSNRIRNVDANNIYEAFLEYDKRFDLYENYADYVVNVALSQWFSGNTARALDLLDGFSEENLVDEVRLIRAAMSLSLTEYEEALKILGAVQSPEALEMKHELLTFLDKVIGIPVGSFEDIKSNGKKGKYDPLFNSIVLMNKNRESHMSSKYVTIPDISDKSVTGRVSINGEPVRGAYVYAKSHGGMSSSVFYDTALHVSDQKGYYHILNVGNEVTGIGIVISWHLIHDKQIVGAHYAYTTPLKEDIVDFEFYDGVRLKSIGTTNGVLQYEIEDPSGITGRQYRIVAKHTNQAYDVNTNAYSEPVGEALAGQLSLDTMRLNSRFAFEFGSSMDELSGDRFIEPLYLSDEYAFSVNVAYPMNTNLYVINGIYSEALDALLYVEGQGALSHGDVLLGKGKVEEAIKWYDENRSLHALKVLKALYSKGYQVDKTLKHWQTLKGADPEKALEYTKALMDAYGETETMLLEVARYYEAINRFEEAAELYEKLIDLSPQNQFYRDKIASMLIHRGLYMDGVRYFDAYVKEEVRRYWWNNILVLGNMTETMSPQFADKLSRIDGVSLFSEFHALIRSGNYEKALAWLQNQPESDLKVMYELLWEDVFRLMGYTPDYDDFFEHYRQTTFDIEDTHVAEVLKAIKLYHNWFN